MHFLQLRGVIGKDIVAMCESWKQNTGKRMGGLLEDTIDDFIIALGGDKSDSSDSNKENEEEEEEENSSDDSDLALPLSDSE
jgi:hypothetical protein